MKSPTSPERRFAVWPHRLAVAMVCVTFPLIWVGGLVTTYDAGMAVPDWPSTYGYNLFLYPWQTWLFGPWDLFIEHGHRLLGSVAGMVTIGFVVAVFRSPQFRWLRPAACFALVLVVAQGLLGGARVLLDQRTMAMVHGCTGPLFFAYAACLAAVTSRRWHERSTANMTSRNDSTTPTDAHAAIPGSFDVRRISGLTILVTGLAYLQLILGAQVRHVPVTATPDDFRVAVVFHVIMAFALLLSVFILWCRTLRNSPPSYIRRPVIGLALLTSVQVALGVGTWIVKYGWPMLGESYKVSAQHLVVSESLWQALTVTAHVATGSLILATAALTAVRALRVQVLQGITSAAAIGLLAPLRGAGNVGWEVAS